MKVTSNKATVSWARLVLAALIVVVFGASLPAGDGTPKPTNLDQLKQQRKKAAHRQRRIIFNNDGNEPVYYLKEATPKALLDCRTTALVGTHVDTIFYCTWSSGFSYFTHDTKVGLPFVCKENKLANNKTREFLDQGTDPLKIMVDFCRKNNIEIFWSMRMNDTHDASGAWYGPLLFPPLKKEHPEWLLGSKDKRPAKGRWTAVDYGRPEIRDLAFKFIEEVCQNYDVDGIEMDFFRHLNYFKRPSMGKEASDEERRMMTDLLRRVRKMTEEIGLERGRPILVAVRVPDSVGYCAAMGFDLVGWMEDDLIDIFVPSGYFRLNPWEVSVELGHKHGVAVYPCLSESRLRGEAGKVRQSLAGYRARATNAWASGADGVYTFNSFNPHSPLWSELGDPKVLQTLDKVYTTGARGVRVADSWMMNGSRFLNRRPVSPERPLKLAPGKTAGVELRVGLQVDATRAGGPAPEVKLRLQIKNLDAPNQLAVKLNGKPLGGATPSDSWFEYSVPASLVKKGINRFELTLQPESKAKPILQDLLLWVRYKRQS